MNNFFIEISKDRNIMGFVANKTHNVRHTGDTLLLHLIGTCSLMSELGGDRDLCLASLLHSIYGTRSLKNDSFSPSPENREILKVIIGEKAESIVYNYSTFDLNFLNNDSHLDQISSLLNLVVVNEMEQFYRAGIKPSRQFYQIVIENECFLLNKIKRAFCSFMDPNDI